MTVNVDRRIAELLCSRICHELVAGIAAINNGVELVSEIDASMAEEALSLIGSSARQASARVQFYRMAYGLAGYEALQSMGAVRELVDGIVQTEERFTLEPSATAASEPLRPGWGKLIMNMVVLAMDCLPRGGGISIGVDRQGGSSSLFATGRGEEARLPDRYVAALAPGVSPDDVTALNIHAYYTLALSASLGDRLAPAPANGVVDLRVKV